MGESEHHGVGGEWRVEPPGVRWDVLDSVAKAAVEMGIAMTPDLPGTTPALATSTSIRSVDFAGRQRVAS
jgi:hypothetical protein